MKRKVVWGIVVALYVVMWLAALRLEPLLSPIHPSVMAACEGFERLVGVVLAVMVTVFYFWIMPRIVRVIFIKG